MQNKSTFSRLIFAVSFSGMILLQACAAPHASLVIGQPDFTSNAANQKRETAANNTLAYPVGLLVMNQEALWVADAQNNRILKFSPVPRENNPSASTVIQSSDPGKWLNLSNPYAPFIANGRMFVADEQNNRILIWNSIPTGNETPDAVLGQNGLTGPVIGDCAHLQDPVSLFAGDDKLIVSDMSNHRVLIWNSMPAKTNVLNPVAADIVLGNSDCSPDATASTRHAFNHPGGIWSDGTRLVVVENGNHRVLIWNHLPARSTVDADIVLGTGKPGAGRDQFNHPLGVSSDGTRLFVTDMDNHRVLMWDKFPTKDGDLPAAVFGQANFNRSGVNGASPKDKTPPPPSDSTMNSPQSVYFTNNQLWVSDTGNNRILMFQFK